MVRSRTELLLESWEPRLRPGRLRLWDGRTVQLTPTNPSIRLQERLSLFQAREPQGLPLAWELSHGPAHMGPDPAVVCRGQAGVCSPPCGGPRVKEHAPCPTSRGAFPVAQDKCWVFSVLRLQHKKC